MPYWSYCNWCERCCLRWTAFANVSMVRFYYPACHANYGTKTGSFLVGCGLSHLWCFGIFYAMGFRYELINLTDKKIEKKLIELVMSLPAADRADFYVKRIVKSFLTARSFRSLVKVQVQENGKSFRSNAEIKYEKGDLIQLEVSHPLGSPLLLLQKKKNSAAQFLAIHPALESQEKWVTPAFERLGDAFFGQFVDKPSMYDLKNAAVKNGQLVVQSSSVRLIFQEGLGQLLKIEWFGDKVPTEDLTLMYKKDLKGNLILDELVWCCLPQKRSFSIKFLKAVLTKKEIKETRGTH